MDITPSHVSSASFRTVRKGYDPDEVDAFLGQVAEALETCQQQATAMEARARAAVARLQELQAAVEIQADSGPPTEPADTPESGTDRPGASSPGMRVTPDEADTISRTLLLAQRTADTTVAEAQTEAARIKQEAQTEAETTIDSTREMSARLLDEARTEARKVSEAERLVVENEVQSLKARREFLIGDVDQLEAFLVDQRERLRGAARQIEALCDRVPAGLGAVRPPAMSASDDEPGDETAELLIPPEATGPFASADELAEALDDADAEVITPMPSDDADPDLSPDDAPQLPIRGDISSSD